MPTSLTLASARQDVSPWRRAISFVLALAAHLLIAWLLLRLAPAPTPPSEPFDPPNTFGLLPEPAPAPAPAAAPRASPKATKPAARSAAPAADRPQPDPPPPVTTPAPTLFGDKSLFEAGDIAGKGDRPGATGNASGDSVAAYGPGEGPGGARLFNAEWQREPTDAELRGYLPGGAPPGSWALIACRTIKDFQVDNCRFLGESPLGSGLAKSMRQAAWQFRVRPPRVGGKTLIGAWVRIRIDFSKSRAE